MFLLYPIWLTIRGAFESDSGFTLHHVLVVFTDPVLRAGLINATAIAIFTTILCIIIAMPLAILGSRCEFVGKGFFSAIILIPLILPPFVGAIGLRHILGRSGSLNTILMDLGIIEQGIDFLGDGGFWAIVLLEALHLYPIVYLNLVASLANLDPALEEAASNVGASRWRSFFRIGLPLIRPGMFAGCTIVFIWSFTELGTPLMFEYHQVTPVQIFNGIKAMQASREPFALTAVMLTCAVLFYLIGKMTFGGRGHAMYAKASRASSMRRLGTWGTVGAIAAFGLVSLVAATPHIGVVLTSISGAGQWYESILPRAFTGEHYAEALTHPLAVGSIRNSIFLATMAMLLDVVVGVMIARILVRSTLPGRSVLDALSMLPLAVPGLVMAFGYVAMTLEWPFSPGMPGLFAHVLEPFMPSTWFAWLDSGPLASMVSVLGTDPNPFPLLIIAYAVRRLPYVVRSTVAGLDQTSIELEEAGLNVGASRGLVTRRIVLPLIVANVIAGALLAFSFAMLEVSDSLILAQRAADFPITKAIYILYERLGDGQYVASAMGTWGMCLLAVTLIASSVLLGKKMGAIFRV
ncbi:MAG: ABC transporter permease [Phycisphaerae bacterium]|nr:ABC transporter permease [Phycisphaerae bacterium]